MTDRTESIAKAHEKIEPMAEIVTGHANRLIAQGCPNDLAWQMAADLHHLLLESQVAEVQIKVAAAQAMAFRGAPPQ